KLVRIIRGHARGVLTNDSGWHLAVNVHSHGGFVYGGEAGRDDDGCSYTAKDEDENLPAVAPEDPEIVGEGDSGTFRLGIVAVPRGLHRLVSGRERHWFRHIVIPP